MRHFGRTDLPDEQARALRKAVRLEWISIAFLSVSIVLVALVMGNSQVMKTAWIEDMLSLVPQIAFLVALLVARRPSDPKHPYGYHRSAGIGHLVAAVALTAVGSLLAVESSIALVRVEHPTIGTVELFGTTVWLGWLMVAVMLFIATPPVILGRMKLKLAPVLHDKVLHADADMNKADWQTNAASIIGVTGVGFGLWWMDSAMALLVSISIVRDGTKNLRAAVLDLMDRRAMTSDMKRPHPLVAEIDARLATLPWIDRAASRARDMGHVFHIESFVVPRDGTVSVGQLGEARRMCDDLDWKVRDIVVVPVDDLPRALFEEDPDDEEWEDRRGRGRAGARGEDGRR